VWKCGNPKSGFPHFHNAFVTERLDSEYRFIEAVRAAGRHAHRWSEGTTIGGRSGNRAPWYACVVTVRLQLRLAALLFALALAVACGPRPYSSLSESAEPLRSQFNRDAGRVRIVMLVAPT